MAIHSLHSFGAMSFQPSPTKFPSSYQNSLVTGSVPHARSIRKRTWEVRCLKLSNQSFTFPKHPAERSFLADMTVAQGYVTGWQLIKMTFLTWTSSAPSY